MKQICIVLCLLCCVLGCWAQENLRDGYVITLQGDTLHGVIDFRTAGMNTRRCVFRQNGKDAFTTYLPGEISGYRFVNNGIYYVSKEVKNQKNTTETVFAEYILHGNMDLYQIGSDEMMIVDEDGNSGSFSLSGAQNAMKIADLRKELREVMPIINKSEKASDILWKKDKNRKNTKAAVMAYVEEMCPDGFCEPFEYKSKITPEEDRTMHPWVKVGCKFTRYGFREYSNVSGSAPQFSFGADFHLNRVLRGLMLNAAVTYEYGKATADVPKLDDRRTCFVSKASVTGFSQLDLMIGPGYQFATGSFMTRVKGGVIWRPFSHDLKYRVDKYTLSGDSYLMSFYEDGKYSFNTQVGLYAGAGVEYPLGKFSIICDVEYIYDYNKLIMGGVDGSNTLVHQNAFCISAGIKF